MAISQLINRTCTLTRRSASGTTDAHGNDVPLEVDVETVCELQQTSRDEPDDGGEVSDSQWTLFFLPDEAVRTGDLVTVDGEEYELTGDPWRARNPRSQVVSHIEATARRTAGADDEVGS